MQIYFHSRLCSYLPRVPILVEGTVCVCMHIYIYIYIYTHTHTQVHLNKLECRGKVNFSNSTQIVELVY